ncbi:caspase [Holotrichia oblita]|uniref:Caspase n=1 Tax=Holotrichia oblita TaxID=644536 RepID=A0ACB9T555_HOLOL|nr:caspase [Holotrichia oblita]
MKELIQSYSRDPILETGDIQVVIIMSHGDGNKETYIETIDKQRIDIEWIVNQFSNNTCPYLAEKPKIFIFQCCRGKRENIEKTDSSSDKEKEQIKKAKEEERAKKEREKKEKEAKEREKKEKEAKEKEEKERARKAKKLKDKDQKNKSITTYDVRPVTANSNGFSTNLGDMEKKLVIKVIKTRKLHPLEDDKIPTYKTKSRFSRGRVLLINNIEFSGIRYRNGADVDHRNISTLCKEMGFKVTSHKNKSEKEMKKIISDYCRDSSLKSADIHITVIMSHGNGEMNNTYIETIDGQLMSIETIVNQFSNERCSYLANKPKIFIFQCCRGKDEDVLGNRPPETDTVSFQTPRNNADMLLAYATVPGFVSHRDAVMGTWYIQSICKTFTEHAHDTDVENLLKIVDENLEKTYKTHRQTSSYENRGFKRCFLNPI